MARAPKHGLGRGLDALLGAAPEASDARDSSRQQENIDAVVTIKLSQIDPNRDQPRKAFSEQALGELAQSIASVGVIQPILVARKGSRYQIIAGERRWRAARLAGLDEIPAIVREFDEVRKLEVMLIENLQRDDLNPVDEAFGVKRLMEQCGYTQENAAERLGKSRPAVANLLRLLNLPEPVLSMLREGKLTSGHGRALASLKDEENMIRLANLAASQGWSVRQLERICAQQADERPERPKKAERAPEFGELERMARDVFGTRAKLEGDAEKGKLVLQYFSAEDLQRIWEVLEFIRQNE